MFIYITTMSILALSCSINSKEAMTERDLRKVPSLTESNIHTNNVGTPRINPRAGRVRVTTQTSKNEATGFYGEQSSLYLSASQIPACTSERSHQLVYNTSIEAFQTCANNTWIVVSISENPGEKGEKGDMGDIGPAGDYQYISEVPGNTVAVDGTLTANQIKSTSSIQVADSAVCDGSAAGSIRFSGGNFQGCDGSEWTTLGSQRKFILASEQFPDGVNAGIGVNKSWEDRDVNTLEDPFSVASLDNGGLRLPAGSYECTISSPAYSWAGVHQIRLWNADDGSVMSHGTTAHANEAGYTSQTRTFLETFFTLSSPKTLKIQHWIEYGAADNSTLGGAAESGSNGVPEIYSTFRCYKVS
jgi:hypothetical protein